MKHRLFTLGSLVSLVLCLATAVMWVRSYWIGEIWAIAIPLWKQPSPRAKLVHIIEIATSRGWYAIDFAEGTAGRGERDIILDHFSSATEEGVTLRIEDPLTLVASRAYSLLLPAVVFAVPPALWLAFRRGRDRWNGFRCRICSYNLTGNTSGVCPECGTPVAGNVEAKA